MRLKRIQEKRSIAEGVLSKHKRNEENAMSQQGWGWLSLKGSLLQAQGSDFGALALTLKPGQSGCACSPRTQRWDDPVRDPIQKNWGGEQLRKIPDINL